MTKKHLIIFACSFMTATPAFSQKGPVVKKGAVAAPAAAPVTASAPAAVPVSVPVSKETELTEKAKKLFLSKDDLGLRIVAKQLIALKPKAQSWKTVREFIHSRPGVGWDLLVLFDQKMPDSAADKSLQAVEAAMDQADAAELKGDSKLAVQKYTEAAGLLRKKGIAFGDPNFFSYQVLLHSLARALYSDGKFKDSIEVYSWISLLYPFLRQVQFEKMWAASRMNFSPLVLGAITSQMSPYFSKYIEPEAYLVQYYIYRRLCRKNDIKRVEYNVMAYKKQLDSNGVTFDEWARNDNETLVLFRLIDPARQAVEALEIVDRPLRLIEMAEIKSSLLERYKKDIVKNKQLMTRVAAYLNLASDATNEDLKPIKKIRGMKTVLASSEEIWMVEDGEEWLDEVGKHFFVGDSECKK